MWKKQKVKAGVLLYAVTMAAIFSILLQFYLNRQVAHYQDYALNKEKLVAFVMAKRTKDRANQESGEQVFNLGKVTYQDKKTGLVTVVRMSKNQYEFQFSSVLSQKEKKDKEKQVNPASNLQANQKKTENRGDKKDNS